MRNLCILLLFFNAFMLLKARASVEDIVPKNLKAGDRYVKVSFDKENKISFEKCLYQINDSCSSIGDEKSYNVTELKNQRIIENLQVGSGVVGVIAGIAVGIYFGIEIGLLSAAEYGFGASLFMIGTTTVSATIGGCVASNIDQINPLHQYDQAKTISNEVLTDKLVKVDNIDTFIENLEEVLKKL